MHEKITCDNVFDLDYEIQKTDEESLISFNNDLESEFQGK